MRVEANCIQALRARIDSIGETEFEHHCQKDDELWLGNSLLMCVSEA